MGGCSKFLTRPFLVFLVLGTAFAGEYQSVEVAARPSWAEHQQLSPSGCEQQTSSPNSLSAFLERVLSGRSAGERVVLIERLMTAISGDEFSSLLENTGTVAELLEMRLFVQLLSREVSRVPILETLRSLRGGLGVEQVQRVQSEQESERSYTKARFIRISSGKFLAPIGPDDQDAFQSRIEEFEQRYDFEVMDTLVTQGMWMEVMGWNADLKLSDYRSSDIIRVNMKGALLPAAPSHPLMGATPASMAEYANRLSLLHGLKPAYVVERDGSGNPNVGGAGSGTLAAHIVSYSNTLGPRGVEGYRLPTEREWLRLIGEFVVELNRLAPEEQIARLHAVGWFAPKGEWATEAVGMKDPMIIGGAKIYDLFGLANEMMIESPILSLPAEYRFQILPHVVSRGGSMRDTWRADQVSFNKPGDRPDVRKLRHGGELFYRGFRLVRTVKPEQRKRGN